MKRRRDGVPLEKRQVRPGCVGRVHTPFLTELQLGAQVRDKDPEFEGLGVSFEEYFGKELFRK